MNKPKNIINKTFGYLHVIERVEDYISPNGDRVIQYLCSCSYENCTNKKIIKGSMLRSGSIISCGCYLKKFLFKDISNEKFGKLTAIKLDRMDKKYGAFWLCVCECNREKVVRATYLRNSHTTSCGECLLSKGEYKIKEWLNKHKIPYQQQKRFDDCKNIYPLPFDFYLPDCNLLLEFQGQQHYDETGYWGGEDKLKRTRKSDKIKRKYCKDNNYTYMEIPYWDLNNISNILSLILLQEG